MQYNPYDLVLLIVNGRQMYGRPVSFDSDVVDQKHMKNAFGKYVKPTQISSTCPDCGQGFIIDVKLSEPPFSAYQCLCPVCKPSPPPMLDPFINPVTTNRISVNELDPILHNITDPIPATVLTVADRMKLEKPKPNKQEKPKKSDKQESKQSKNKQKPIVATAQDDDGFVEYNDAPKSTKLEPAEGMDGDEIDFDDEDLVEP